MCSYTRPMISIHASAKEATTSASTQIPYIHDFNPRLREGGDPRVVICSPYRFDFNPRLREGGDIVNSHRLVALVISIHASAKEATSLSHTINLSFRISIHASAKEATESFIFVFFIMLFQSTPPRRRRPQHIVIPQLSCTYLVSTTFLSTFFSFISQYVVLFFLF